LAPSIHSYQAEILENQPIGNYFRLLFQDNGALQNALPGQFVNIRLSEGYDPLLRRPFSIARLLPGPKGKSRVEVLYAALRQGTQLLAEKKPGNHIGVLGPLGLPFPRLDSNHPALIVSGGIGVAPLVYLSEYLKKKKRSQAVFLGARTAGDLVDLEVFRKLKVPLHISTDDGSKGRRGFVTEILEEYLGKRKAAPGTVIYSCGPRPMFRAVAKVAEKFGVPAFLSWEEHMACGLGICLTCVCPLKQETGHPRMARSCYEGPVFEASKIDWEHVKST
jgi:dihydroorotate dehydrogenase electron transfer subunit